MELLTELARAVRSLWRTPGPTAAAVAALALGVGAATAIFSAADVVLLRPLPYAEAERLVSLEGQFLALGMRDIGASPSELLDYRARARSFEAIAAFSRSDRNLSGGAEPERVATLRVSAELLGLLGIVPARGRDFLPGDSKPGADGVAILSWGLWQRRFGGEEGVVGRTITLDGRACTVVGITPRDVTFPPPGPRFGGEADVFVPMAFSAEERTARSEYSLVVLARRRPDVPLAAAAAEMSEIARALESEYPQSYRGPGGEDGGWRVHVVPLRDAVVGDTGRTVVLLFAAVVTLLLIACVDVAHLLLARAVAGRRALAVRLALGASRGRLVRGLALESLALALIGGGLGALVAVWATRLLVLSGVDIPRLAEATVDERALAFAVAASLVAALLAGIGPALQATRDPPGSVVILARTAGDPLALLPSIRDAVRAVDPQQPVSHVRTLDQIVAQSITGRRAPALLLAGFALVALTLAGLGTYGVMSYAVSGRAHEIGVRMALGARPSDVARLVVGEGARLALAGAAIGLLAAVALGGTVSSLLFEIRPTDPVTLAGAAASLVGVALAACGRPALRAARVDPAVALREE